jgi:CRISPR system Cascade subunit CasB
MSEGQGRGQIAADWWLGALADRDSGPARALAARLRRAQGVAVLAEPAVQDLARRIGAGPAAAALLVRLAQTLAELRTDDRQTLAQRLGGAEPVLSTLRFQRLLRARDADFADQLRRAVIMADRRCNVARLAGDLMVWDHPDLGDAARARWCFHYFGAAAPAGTVPEPQSEEAPE